MFLFYVLVISDTYEAENAAVAWSLDNTTFTHAPATSQPKGDDESDTGNKVVFGLIITGLAVIVIVICVIIWNVVTCLRHVEHDARPIIEKP